MEASVMTSGNGNNAGTTPPSIIQPKIIALYSPAPGCGKSTVANHLNKAHGYAVVKFAMPLKAMMSTLLEYMGYDNPDIVQKMIEGELKQRPLMGFDDVTPRYMMQTLGTEWGRGCIDENFWVRIATNRIRYFGYKGIPVVVDDLRFPNEFDALELLGAKLVKINRPSVQLQTNHASEGLLEGHDFDVEIENTASVNQLLAMADRLTD